MRETELVLHIDGASRGNPGMSGAGVWMADREGRFVHGISKYLGHKTNNQAEYWALLLGLQEARRLGCQKVRIFTDSELMERQIKGVYRVKDPKLRVLYEKVLRVLRYFSAFEIAAIPRELNREADRLANRAIEGGLLKGKKKGGNEGEGMVAPSHRRPGEGGGEESPSSRGQGGP